MQMDFSIKNWNQIIMSLGLSKGQATSGNTVQIIIVGFYLLETFTYFWFDFFLNICYELKCHCIKMQIKNEK